MYKIVTSKENQNQSIVKKLLTLSILFLATLISSAQIVNIPDANLKNKLLNHDPVIDTNGDGEIQVSEANVYTGTIDVSGAGANGIIDITGLEAFVNVNVIDLELNDLSSADFSEMTNLETLILSQNNFTNDGSLQLPTSLQKLFLEYSNLQGTFTLSGLPNLITLYLAYNDITGVDLSGLNNLEELYLYQNDMLSINSSDLPISIQKLGLGYNSLDETSTNLSGLIDLKELLLYHNNFSNINGSLFPQNLEKLSMSSNNFTDASMVDLATLSSLKSLSLASHDFTVFSLSNIPTNLEILDLSRNNLSLLPISSLPNLKDLNLSYNNVASLDASWSNLEKLKLQENNISTVNLSTYTQLLELNVSDNNLTTLVVDGSPNLEVLRATDNNLTSVTLSNLINLFTLTLSNNQLTTIDLSPYPNLVICGLSGNLFTELDFSSNPLIQGDWALINLPNLEHLNIKTGTSPYLFNLQGVPNLESVCVDDLSFYEFMLDNWWETDAVLTTYCSFVPGQYNTISGEVKRDSGAGCADASAVALANVFVKTIDNTTGTTSSATFTDVMGHYSLYVDQGTFATNAHIDLPAYYTATPTSQSSVFTGYGNVDQADFCLQGIQAVDDLNITILPIDQARPGFESSYKIIYGNIGTTTLSGQVVFQFDATKQIPVSAVPAQTSFTTNTLTFDYLNLLPFQTKEITVTMDTQQPPTVDLGDVLSFTANIAPSSNDQTPDDNTFQLTQTVVNSYDPNNKRVLEGEEIGIADADEYLHYLIRFQNIGTASAINVVVTDTLSEKLNWNSIRMISASHDYRTQITNGNFVEFIFENINLPQKTVDEPGSHGYVAFKIKPKDNIALGDIIEGKAAIYFDYNSPIITNTVSTEIVNLSAENFEMASTVQLYPNPTKGILNISSEASLEKIEVFSITGMRLLQRDANMETIDLHQFSDGIYFLKITDVKGRVITKKVVKR